MTATQPSLDRETFLAHVRQSGLLSAEQLKAAAKSGAGGAGSRGAARALVQQGLLTRFQAERLLAGRTGGFILGQYRILDQLGSGGMGRVYMAEHRTMNRVVALKLLAPHLMRTERAQTMFLREVRAAARLVHPNIVAAYDANHDPEKDRHYLVLEYVDGPNLDQLVRKQGPLTIGLACDLVRQIALGLQCAHELGMVHRDIKPANILVQRGDRQSGRSVAKVSDFGLARLHDSEANPDDNQGTILTKENTVMGTPDYLSPEQARSLHKVDIRSDLYSLGCTFYYLLTGRVPFPGGTTLEKLIRHSTVEPEPAQAFRSDLPLAVISILNRLMAKDREARFQTPIEVASVLEPFSVHGPTTWLQATSTAKEVEGELVPSYPTSSNFDFDLNIDLPPSDQAAALRNTLPTDQSPTPLATVTENKPPRVQRSLVDHQRRRLWIAIGLAIAIVAGLLAAIMVFSAEFNGK